MTIPGFWQQWPKFTMISTCKYVTLSEMINSFSKICTWHLILGIQLERDKNELLSQYH